jgi:hypothetical protein
VAAQVGHHEVRFLGDLAPRVAQDREAAGAQGKVAPVVVFDVAGGRMCAPAVELDDDLQVTPDRIHEPSSDPDVVLGLGKGVALDEEDELLLQAATGASELGEVVLERCSQCGAARLATAEDGCHFFEGHELPVLGFGQRLAQHVDVTPLAGHLE